MNLLNDTEIQPEISPTPLPQRRKKGRRLRSAANVRALVAHTLREIEASTTMDPTDRARLLLYGSQVLCKVLDTGNEIEVKKLMRDAKQKLRALGHDSEARDGV